MSKLARPRVTGVVLAGDVIVRRSATITGVPEEGVCLVSLPSLGMGEDRVLKLEIVEERAAVASPTPNARR
jgi:hypothetical protein